MIQMKPLKKMIICAISIALCYVLPLAFHAVGMGPVFCPMHLPVLLCGLVCGFPYGMLCGIAGPFLSGVTTGMPAAALMPIMMMELGTYGLISGILSSILRTRRTYLDLYLSLIPAMLMGRVIAGVAAAFFFTHPTVHSVAGWASAYFVTNLPGAVIQLLLLPVLVLALMRAGIIPLRYGKESI